MRYVSLVLMFLVAFVPSSPGIDFSVLQHILQCPFVRVLEVKQNKACWEVVLSGQGVEACVQPLAVKCIPHSRGYFCRVLDYRVVEH